MILNDALWIQTTDQEKNFDVVINEKFIFIQIPKTGSTSVVSELKKHSLTQNIKCYRHEGFKYIQHLYENKNIPVYAIVRNPYRQTLSYFFHKVNYGEMIIDKNNVVYEFRKWCRENNLSKNVHLLQTTYLETNNNKIKETIRVFKFEDGIDFFIQYLNLNHNLELNINTHINQNKVSEYKNVDFLDFFDSETINIIKTQLQLQFDSFEYSTDITQA
jgi:hypothetical protein